MSRLSTVFNGLHMSPYLVLSLCDIVDICCHRFINWNLAGLLSIVAEISTQFSMMSCSENEAVNAPPFNMMNGHFVEFVQSICSKTDHFTAYLGTNMIEHVCKVGLYIILSTLDSLNAGIKQF